MHGGIIFSEELKEKVRQRLLALIDSRTITRQEIADHVGRTRDSVDNLLNCGRHGSSALIHCMMVRMPKQLLGPELVKQIKRELTGKA